MSDFLTRIIRRTQGSAPVAQPLGVSRFARLPAVEVPADEGIKATPPPVAPLVPEPPPQERGRKEIAAGAPEGQDEAIPLPARGTSRPPGPGTGAPLEGGGTAGAAAEELLVRRFQRNRVALPVAPPVPGTTLHLAALEPGTPEALLVPRPRRAGFSAPTKAAASGSLVHQGGPFMPEAGEVQEESPSSPGSNFPALPGTTAGPTGQARPELPPRRASPQKLEPPPVQVTIGRVEVRAVMEAPAAPPPVPPPTAKMSLAEYLRQGKEGRR
jgi:hypothetical protein